jgi:hypothetical protein
MKKLVIMACCIVVSGFISLNEYQKQQVRQITKQYYNLLGDYASSPNNINLQPSIINLFQNDKVHIYDNVKEKVGEELRFYLRDIVGIYRSNLTIKPLQNIDNLEVVPYKQPSMSDELENCAKIEVSSSIVGQGINRNTISALIINLNTMKIISTLKGTANTNYNQVTSSISPQEMWERGLIAYNQKDHKKALEWFVKSAEGNYFNGQYAAGTLYMKGEGTRKKVDDGVKWLVKAARQGHKYAQRDLDRLGVEWD